MRERPEVMQQILNKTKEGRFLKTEQNLVTLVRMEVAGVEAYKVCEIFISFEESSLMLHKRPKDKLLIRFGHLEVTT